MTFLTAASAGLAAVQWSRLNLTGQPMGTTGTLAAGSAIGMYLLKYSQEFGGPIPNPIEVAQTGDNNASRSQFLFNAATLGPIPMTFGMLDATFFTSCQGLNVYTLDNFNIFGMESNQRANAVQGCFVATIDTLALDLGLGGLKRYANLIYPVVTTAPLFVPLKNVTKEDYGYHGIATQATNYPFGPAFSLVNEGATRMARVCIFTDYPVTIDSFAGNGSTVNIPLQYNPAGVETSGYVEVWSVTSTGTVTKILPTSGYTVTLSSTAPKVVASTAPATGTNLFVLSQTQALLQAI